jgi:O-antigen ligase
MLEATQNATYEVRGTKVRRRITKIALDSAIRWSMALLITLVLIGYPIAGSIAQIFNLESTVTSYPFRGGVLALSVGLTFAILARQKYEIALLIVFFFAAYTIRMIVDLEVGGYPEIETDILYFLATVMAPTIAMGASRYYSERITALLLTVLGAFACALILYGLQTSNIYSAEISFSTRAVFEALNPITIGYTGLYTAAGAYVVFLISPWRTRIWVAIPAILLGLTVLVVGGSRGPLVAAGLFLAVYAFTRTTGIIALVFSVLGAFMLFNIVGQDLAIVQRFTDISGDPSVWTRVYVQELSIDAALANPIFGSSYVEPITLAYPHNLLIESAMALGLFGFVLMAAIQIRLVLDTYFLLRNEHMLIPFIAVTSLANAYISGSLYGSANIFIVVVLARITTRIIQQGKNAASANALSRELARGGGL